MATPSPVAAPNVRWQIKVTVIVGAALFTLAVMSAIGEMFLRYRESHRTTVPGSITTLFYPHGQFGWALVRNYEYYGFMHVNAQGFRGSRNTDIDAKGAFRIMAVGASTTFDSFVTGGDGNTWPAQLEQQLTKRVTGRHLEVLNAGVPGYVLWQNSARYHTELYKYRPDLVLLLHGHNELLRALRDAVSQGVAEGDRPDEVVAALPWSQWLLRHSLLYGKVLAKWKAIRWVSTGSKSAQRASITPDQWSTAIAKSASEYARELETFVAIARTDSARVVLLEMVHVSPPDAADEKDPLARFNWQATVPTAPVDVVLRAYQAYNAVTRQVGKQLGVPVIATTTFGLSGTRWYSEGDPIHFNAAGAASMAEHLADALMADSLVSSTAGLRKE